METTIPKIQWDVFFIYDATPIAPRNLFLYCSAAVAHRNNDAAREKIGRTLIRHFVISDRGRCRCASHPTGTRNTSAANAVNENVKIIKSILVTLHQSPDEIWAHGHQSLRFAQHIRSNAVGPGARVCMCTDVNTNPSPCTNGYSGNVSFSMGQQCPSATSCMRVRFVLNAHQTHIASHVRHSAQWAPKKWNAKERRIEIVAAPFATLSAIDTEMRREHCKVNGNGRKKSRGGQCTLYTHQARTSERDAFAGCC